MSTPRFSHDQLLAAGTFHADTAGEPALSAFLSDRPYSPSRGCCYFSELGRDGLTDRLRTHGTRLMHQK